MAQPLRFPAKPSTRLATMTLGDVLFRLALVSPDKYRHIDTLVRCVFRDAWPSDQDVLNLLTPEQDRPKPVP